VKRKTTAPAEAKRRRILVDDTVVADELDIEVKTLRDSRAKRRPPLGTISYYKIGRRVRYDPEDIRKLKEACRVVPEARS
jgi:hypothetical protein